MSRKRGFQTPAPAPEKTNGHAHGCYSAAQIIALLNISPRSFFEWKRRGELPFVEELRPRLGRSVRYRADLIERYLRGEWSGSSFRQRAR